MYNQCTVTELEYECTAECTVHCVLYKVEKVLPDTLLSIESTGVMYTKIVYRINANQTVQVYSFNFL